MQITKQFEISVSDFGADILSGSDIDYLENFDLGRLEFEVYSRIDKDNEFNGFKVSDVDSEGLYRQLLDTLKGMVGVKKFVPLCVAMEEAVDKLLHGQECFHAMSAEFHRVNEGIKENLECERGK